MTVDTRGNHITAVKNYPVDFAQRYAVLAPLTGKQGVVETDRGHRWNATNHEPWQP